MAVVTPQTARSQGAQTTVLGKPIVATEGEDAPASTIRVVIADDHVLTRRGVAGVLEAADGFEVVAEAEDLAGARRKVLGHHPDVLVLGLHLPDGLGLDAIPETRRSRARTAPCDPPTAGRC